MFCNKCGNQVPDGVSTCPTCGNQMNANTTQSNMNYGQMPQYSEGSGKAGFGIASMVLGICALVFSCCVPYLPFFLAIVGVVLGGISLNKHYAGRGMAIAGLVCSIISLVPAILFIAGVVSVASLGL